MQESPNIDISNYNKKKLGLIEDLTQNAGQIQKRVLSEILTRNSNVEYLQRHGLNGAIDGETFKKLIPVIEYEDVKPYITRIANGDKSPILSSYPISEFLTSSGTSGGERKLMPIIEEDLDRKALVYSLMMPITSQLIAGLENGKGMYFFFIKSEAQTPGGLLARTALTSYYKSTHFRNPAHDPYNNYTSPIEAILCLDSHQSMYAQLLCGLCQHNEVNRVGAVFASGFIRVIKFLEKNWVSLAQDIRTGILCSQISDPSVRQIVGQILKPNPQLADFIEYECGKCSWQGIITRLWSNTKYVDAVVTGSMAQYIPTLNYYTNGLPLVSMLYASSECYFGVNLNPLCKPNEIAYTMIPNMGYFEFLPVHHNSDSFTNSISIDRPLHDEKEQCELIDLVDVKVGQEYELVITTYAGLYRYKVGDVLRVAGFKNNAPQFIIMRRKNVLLSIDSDKTDESELQNAVNKATTKHLIPLKEILLDYTSYADTSTIPGHYVVFWELGYQDGSTPIPQSVFEDCCLTIEESLNSVYRQGRVFDKSIGPLEIRLVGSGTFDLLMDYVIGLGGSMSQYKTPRCVKYEPLVKLLDSRVVSRYFSKGCPEWHPDHKLWRNGNERG